MRNPLNLSGQAQPPGTLTIVSQSSNKGEASWIFMEPQMELQMDPVKLILGEPWWKRDIHIDL